MQILTFLPRPSAAQQPTSLARRLGWTRSSIWLMSVFLAIVGLILIVWWPLVVEYTSTYDARYPLWAQLDWLLVGVFAAMSLLIMARADVRSDWVILLVGMGGGLVIETWGTQTQLWTYYTLERPPLWIIPAWPIASLSIDRLYRLLLRLTRSWQPSVFRWLYWTIMPGFLAIMIAFVGPTFDKSLTWAALALCILLTLTPHDERGAVLTFLAGAGPRVLPRTLGHDSRLLDLLHRRHASAVRRPGARHGCVGLLEDGRARSVDPPIHPPSATPDPYA